MDFAHATVKAQVGGTAARGELRQSGVRLYEAGSVAALACAFGPPRLWGFGLDAVFEGLTEGLASASPEALLSARLYQTFDHAVATLKVRVDSLIERSRCDLGLALLAFGPTHLHVLSVGPVQVFLERAGSLQQLTRPDDGSSGMLKLRPTVYMEALEPGSLVLAGSQAAFTPEALARVDGALARSGSLGSRAALEALNKVPVANGAGVSSLAVFCSRAELRA